MNLQKLECDIVGTVISSLVGGSAQQTVLIFLGLTPHMS